MEQDLFQTLMAMNAQKMRQEQQQQQQQQQQLNKPKATNMKTEPEVSWQSYQQRPTLVRPQQQQQQLFDSVCSAASDAEDAEVAAATRSQHLNKSSTASPAKTTKTNSTNNPNQGGANTGPVLCSVESLCQKSVANILANLKNNKAVTEEEELWKIISKDYRNNLTAEIAHYLIGFYGTMCEVLFLVSQPEDPFVRTNRVGFNMADTNRALLYSLHIHLGDLYRYINLNQNARHYYKQALEIDPARGTVYQKLAFCTPLTKAYRCLYFSIMAANATKAASPMAASNIATVLSRMDTFHFEKFREQLGVKLDMAKVLKVEPPSDGADWFYLVVISIHFNNFNVTCLALLDYLIAAVDDEERKSSGDLDFTLMALEVAIDWITINRNSADSAVHTALTNMGLQTKDGEPPQQPMNIALKHNFLLRNFKPLSKLYSSLVYDESRKVYHSKRDRIFLKERLSYKLQNF